MRLSRITRHTNDISDAMVCEYVSVQWLIYIYIYIINLRLGTKTEQREPQNFRLETKSDSREKSKSVTSDTCEIGQRHEIRQHTLALLRAKIPSCDTLDSTNLYVL